MSRRRTVSSSLLLTLAEFAWLVVFALLLLMRGKDNDQRETNRQLQIVWQDAMNFSNLVEKLNKGSQKLQDDVSGYRKALEGMNPDEAVGLRKKLFETETARGNALAQLAAKEEAYAVASSNSLYLSNKFALIPADLLTLHAQIVEKDDELRNSQHGREESTLKVERLTGELDQLAKRIEKSESEEFVIRREITGLPSGQIGRVVILLDTSSSMRESTAWNDARTLVRVWLTYLPIKECVLVNFNSEVQVFPSPKEGFLLLRDSNHNVIEQKQALLLSTLDQLRVGTYTDTLTAFKTAYSFERVDLILLFTDGRPQTQFESSERLVRRIYDLVNQHRKIPILAVGLGDYEKLEHSDKRAAVNLQIQFLKNLAKMTGGVFMGR